jgi:hypothetical protein
MSPKLETFKDLFTFLNIKMDYLDQSVFSFLTKI